MTTQPVPVLLPPDVEQRLRAAEERIARDIHTLEDSLDDDGEIDFDDPSVVRHIEDFRRQTERARRESTGLALDKSKNP